MTKQDLVYEITIDNEIALILGVIDLRMEDGTSEMITALDSESFMCRDHNLIWKAFQQITAKGQMIDEWVTRRCMQEMGAIDTEVQAMTELFSRAIDHFGAADLRPRVARVADAYKRRLLNHSMIALANRALTENLSDVEADFSELSNKVSEAGNPQVRQSTDYSRQYEAFLNGEPMLPIESRDNLITVGIPGIDQSIVANPGRLIVIGGLPSAGKTALAIQIAVETARRGRRVAMGSLEMDEDEIASRIVACSCSVNSLVALRVGSKMVGPNDRKTLGAIRRNIVGVHGCAGDSWTSIEAAIVREHRRSPLSVAIVDYLQLLGMPDTKRKGFDNEAQMIGEITKSAKRLAQRLRINVLVLSQFNRKVEENQEPTLQNFLGSGQIERDIDIALLLWNTDKDPRTRGYSACSLSYC